MGCNGSELSSDGTCRFSSRPEQIVASGVIAVAAGCYHSLFVKSDGSLWTMGENQFGQLGDQAGNGDVALGKFEPRQIVPQPTNDKALARY